MIRVRVPATSANLGPGFDALGLALGLYNLFEVEEAEGLFFEGCPREFQGPENLFARALRRGYEEVGRPFLGVRVRFAADIPIARGLGSSAACIAGGLVAAGALSGRSLPRERLLDLAAELEGHPDNTTPALLGGFAVSVADAGRVHALRVALGEGLRFSALVPPFPLETALARAALPTTLPFKDAVHNLGHAALVTAAFMARDWDKLSIACHDRLHEPYRASLIPGFSQAVDGARDAGALAVFLSGAGPTIMAISPSSDASFPERMTALCASLRPEPWQALDLEPDDKGAILE